MKNYLKTLLLYICISYTMVSVSGAVVNIVGGTQTSNSNTLIMFGLCVIASFVLSLNRLFDELSPLLMIILQYVIVIACCGAFLFVLSFIDPISPKGWFEYFRSFTVPYVFIAAIYYYSLYAEAKKQDQMIKEIQEGKE
ncbi:MAG: hypothetical protein K6E50_14805 [Lachnospiraceae bacterium]|nr:hypothetical protein [Lachnospiraceae bacterium]